MKKERKDITGAKYVRGENGSILVEENEINERWKRYFDGLLRIRMNWKKKPR